ncbi:hypothetical protein FRC19_006398 [Serendipita sp. 401]|nr:hypothetical protein FRC19_006398 [Serendipita sp. 401]KAG9054324.1 hypothetical protein FS842_005454 [Serendipita sp. 407]
MTAGVSVAELIKIMNNLFIGRMCSAVAITLVMYDWILVFPREYATIYQSRWSLPKLLLLYVRLLFPHLSYAHPKPRYGSSPLLL